MPYSLKESDRERHALLQRFRLLMTALVIVELRQSGGNPFKMSDRLFVATTFTVAFICGVVLLASRVSP
jgi:hypothetical protein